MPIDLAPFCSRDREGMMAPWSKGEWTYACDGAIGVRVPRRPDVTSEDGPPFQEMMDAREEARNLQPLPSVRIPPYLPDKTPYRIAGGLIIQARYAALIASLPQSRIDIGCLPDNGPIRFTFDGGDGMVMPIAWRPGSVLLEPETADADP